MPKIVEIPGRGNVEFPDNMTDEQIASVIRSQQSEKVIYGPKQQAPSQPQDRGVGQTALDVLEGIGSGVFKTVGGTAKILGIDSPTLTELAQTPPTPGGRFGNMFERGAEFFLPAGMVSKGAALLRNTPRAVQLLGGAALEAGSAAGVAGLQSGGDPEAMKEAGLYAGGGTAAIGALGAAAGPTGRWLKRAAETQYGKVLNPTKEGTKFISRTETIPGMLERRVTAGTMEGFLNRTQAEVKKWGKAVDDAWNRVPQNTPLDLNPMIQAIDDSVAHASVGGVNLGPVADTMVGHASQIKDMLTKLAKPNPQTGALEITVGDLRKVREFSDKIAAKAGAFEGKTIADESLKATYETTANAARQQLAQRYPHVAKANEQFHFWKDAEKVLDQTIQRRVGQERGLIRGIGDVTGGLVGTAVGGMIGGPTGAAIGGPAAALTTDVIQRLMTSPGWRTVNAVFKQRLSEALASGNRGAVEFWLQKIGASIGGSAATRGSSLQQPSLQPSGAPE